MAQDSVQDELLQKYNTQKKWLTITVVALAIALAAFLAYTFQLRQTLNNETLKASQLASELDATKKTLTAEIAEKTRRAAELAATQGRLVAELSRKPPMPIRLSYRKSLMGAGLVAVFRNTSTQHLSVLATFTNPQLNATSTFRLELPPDTDVPFGHVEGWRFNPGDELALANKQFEPLKSVAAAP